MIEDEVSEVLSSEGDLGAELNSLVDQYRGGRDAEDLLRLLHSKSDDLVKIGAYILGEISFECYNTPVFINQLRKLTEHDNPVIRLHALGALFPSLDGTRQETLDLITKLRGDPNEGVRMGTEAAAKQLGV